MCRNENKTFPLNTIALFGIVHHSQAFTKAQTENIEGMLLSLVKIHQFLELSSFTTWSFIHLILRQEQTHLMIKNFSKKDGYILKQCLGFKSTWKNNAKIITLTEVFSR